jgi:hydroxylamine reductase (hybrid-cluster protein)
MAQNNKEKLPACGYGLLGLCCSACLLGPCRVSPFENESAKGLCGDDRDLMVAKNLLRLITSEAARGMESLKEMILHLDSLDLAQRSKKRPAKKEEKGLAQKYGFPSNLSTKKLVQSLVEVSRNLLSPFPESTSLFLSSLYPEKVFPNIYQDNFLSESLTSLLLDSMKFDQQKFSEVEGILGQCLRISIHTLISEELRYDLQYLIDREGLPDKDKKALDILNCLPQKHSPVIILLSSEEAPYDEFINRMAEDLVQKLKGTSLLIPITGIASLPDIGQRLFKKWSLSVAEMNAIVLISSKSVTPVLGALILGFTVASFPSLPIHGSGRVEKFFFEDFKKRFGNTYLPFTKEGLFSSILEFLRGSI